MDKNGKFNFFKLKDNVARFFNSDTMDMVLEITVGVLLIIALIFIILIFNKKDEYFTSDNSNAVVDNTEVVDQTSDSDVSDTSKDTLDIIEDTTDPVDDINDTVEDSEQDPDIIEESDESTVDLSFIDNHVWIGDSLVFDSGIVFKLNNIIFTDEKIDNKGCYLEVEFTISNSSHDNWTISYNDFLFLVDENYIELIDAEELISEDNEDTAVNFVYVNSNSEAEFLLKGYLDTDPNSVNDLEILIGGEYPIALVLDGVQYKGTMPNVY